MTNPQLLILDEATEGLAPLIVAEIWRVVAEVRAIGISSLNVDRNHRAVLADTDRAVVMEKGQIVLAQGSAELAGAPEALGRHWGSEGAVLLRRSSRTSAGLNSKILRNRDVGVTWDCTAARGRRTLRCARR
jgi:energy-coupling factor transporter ATP-binding protein EcfA2